MLLNRVIIKTFSVAKLQKKEPSLAKRLFFTHKGFGNYFFTLGKNTQSVLN